MEERKKYRTGIYIRISKEDGSDEESNSVRNQREFLTRYVESQDSMQLCMEWVDDGYSGVTFKRPGFLELLKAVNLGEITCLVVKDLSRLGRNYIETGRYLEQIFPAAGVRFVAVNDGYDSAESTYRDRLFLPFKNLIKDTSF